MTTWTGTLDTFTASTTAGLQAVVTSVQTIMGYAGFTASADTGQLVIGNLTWSGTTNSTFGYQVYYLDDSLHGTYPIYVRIYYRIPTTNVLGIGLTVGHATDGAGNITGFKVGSDTTYMFSAGSNGWGSSSSTSLAVTLDGYGFWSLANSATSGGNPWFMIAREWDDATGDIAGTGNYALTYFGAAGSTAPTQVCVDRTLSATITQSNAVAFVPGLVTNSQDAATTDIFRHYHQYPVFTVAGNAHTYHVGEIATGTSYSAQVLTGGASRTFFATGIPRMAAGSTGAHGLAVLWE